MSGTVGGLIPGADGKRRCFGNGDNKAFYAHYHDTEWGVPVYDDRTLFEMLILEGAQAGLSWETVLKKRDGYRQVFRQFDVDKVARLTDKTLEKAVLDSRIIRHRQKIFATRKNARVFLDLQQEFDGFSNYLWGFVDGRPIVNTWKRFEDVPTSTPESDALSKDLKKRGMSFVGSTICYAYMQGVGLVDDHLADCWIRAGCD